MTLTLSVGSGKGGTGKSMVLANLALLLAQQQKKVCVIDLDLGGANIHILFGLFAPKRCLTDFFNRQVSSLGDITYTLESFHGLQIIPGTGETLQTANMSYQEKTRLLRALHDIEADIVLIDVGAGTNYHALDFFLASDLQICVTMPDPASILDLYRFIQLATIRKALGSFPAQGHMASTLKNHTFTTLSELFESAETIERGARKKIQSELMSFQPLLLINRVVPGSRINTLKLRKLVAKYLGIDLPELGEIPADENVNKAILAYLPVCEYAPTSQAAEALHQILKKLLNIIELFNKTDQTKHITDTR